MFSSIRAVPALHGWRGPRDLAPLSRAGGGRSSLVLARAPPDLPSPDVAPTFLVLPASALLRAPPSSPGGGERKLWAAETSTKSLSCPQTCTSIGFPTSLPTEAGEEQLPPGQAPPRLPARVLPRSGRQVPPRPCSRALRSQPARRPGHRQRRAARPGPPLHLTGSLCPLGTPSALPPLFPSPPHWNPPFGIKNTTGYF